MDVTGDSQGKGYQVAQGVKHMMHQKWWKEMGLFHQQNRRLEAEGEYIHYLQSGISWRFTEKGWEAKGKWSGTRAHKQPDLLMFSMI